MTQELTLTTTFKQKIKSGEIKRADSMKVRLKDIFIEEGFNLRISIELLSADDRKLAEEEDRALFEHIANGGNVPPLETRPRAEGGVWLVDGHRRHKAFQKAVDAALLKLDDNGDYWIPIVSFEGDDAERKNRILSSNENQKLHPISIANGYRDMNALGWSVEKIAEARRTSTNHVTSYILVANADLYVKNAVIRGDIKITAASKLVRKYGDLAAKTLREKLEGGGKVSESDINGKPLPLQIVKETEEGVAYFFGEALAGDELELVKKAVSEPEKFADECIPVRAGDLAELLKIAETIKQEREKQAQRSANKSAREKAKSAS